MMIFSSLEKAKEHGFHWVEFRTDLGVHLVERVLTQDDGKKARALALAKADQTERDQGGEVEDDDRHPLLTGAR